MLNIATCFVTGSIETVMSVSVLWPPSCSSAPMSRMFRRFLPSHGGIDTSGTWLPSDGSGVGEGVAAALGSGVPVGVRRRGRIGRALLVHVVADEDAAAGQRVEGEHVVAGHDDVAAGHDQHDGEQAGGGQRVARQPGLAESSVAGHRVGVQVLGHAVGIDDRDQPVQQRDEVEDEDRGQQERAEQQRDELDPVHPQQDARAEGDQQDGRGGEAEGARRRAGVELAKARKDQGKECRREWRPGARSRPLRFLHRA